MGTREEREGVRAAIRALLEKDRADGALGPADRYKALFPGFWDVVAEEHEAVVRATSGAEATITAVTAAAPTTPGPGAAPATPGPEPVAERIGPYLIVRELGRGGMGVVYEARDSRLPRRVALKVLNPQFATSTHLRLRFQREAELASKLDHPHVCTVYEAGEDDGTPYLAMRYVEGRPLSDLVVSTRERIRSSGVVHVPQMGEDAPPPGTDSRERRLDLDRVLVLFEKASRALHYAHEKGLIHRDIKPHNIMVTAEGEPVLLDFGLAREEAGEGQQLTQTGSIMGTPAYMSPEQLRAQQMRLDRRTDVYSMGVSLYECLTLRLPFEAPTVDRLYQRILTTDPEDPARLNQDLPADMKIVLETALEKDRDRRYQSALDLAEELRRVREHEPIRAKPMGPATRLVRWAQRHPAVAASASVALAALAALVAGAILYAVDLQKANVKISKERDTAVLATQREVAERRRADGLRLASQSAAAVEKDPALALALAVEAHDRAPGPAAVDALYGALSRSLERRRLIGHDGYVQGGCWSRDGARVLTWEWGPCAILWDAASGQALHRLLGHESAIETAVLSPDGTRVATASADGTARLWDAASGECRSVLRGHTGTVGSAAFSPDGVSVATCGEDGTVRLWSAATGTEERVLRGHEGPVRDVAFSPAGGAVASIGDDGVLRLWDTATGAALGRSPTRPGGGDPASSPPAKSVGGVAAALAFAAGGRVVATWENGGELRLHCIEEGGIRIAASRPNGSRAAVSGDGTRIAACARSVDASTWTLERWDVAALASSKSVEVPAELRGLSLDRTGRRLAGTDVFDIHVWDLDEGRHLSRLRGHKYFARQTCWSPDGSRILSAASDSTARIWDAESPDAVRLPPGVPVESVAPDGRRMLLPAGDADGATVEILVADTRTGESSARFPAAGPVRSIRWLPDGDHALVAAGGRIRILEIPSGRAVGEVPFPEGWDPGGPASGFGGPVRMSEDRSRVAVRHPDGTWAAADLSAGTWLQARVSAGGSPDAVLSPDGRLLLTADGGRRTATFWNWATGKAESVLFGHTGFLVHVAWSADGKRVATSALDTRARTWDATSGRPLQTFGPTAMAVNPVAFGNRDRLLGVLSAGEVLLFDSETGSRVATLKEPSEAGPAKEMWFLPEGGGVATCTGAGGILRRWPLDPLRVARERLPTEIEPRVASEYGLVPEAQADAFLAAWLRRHPTGRGLAQRVLSVLRARTTTEAMEWLDAAKAVRPDLAEVDWAEACARARLSSELPEGPGRDAERGKALAALERAVKGGAYEAAQVREENLLAPLRSDPRFAALISK